MKNKIERHPTTLTNFRRRRSGAGYLSALLSVLCYVSAAIWLTACTNDIAPADEPVAGSPVELTARVAGHVQSRATTDNTWTGSEEVGVQLDGKCYKYIADAGGKLTLAPGQEIPRWNSLNEQKAVIAWYPYSDKLPETFAVYKDQTDNSNYHGSDFLLAKETRISISNPEITFRHLPAKVVVNLKAGDGVTNEDLSNASVDFHFYHKSVSERKLVSGTINPIEGTVGFPTTVTEKDNLFMNALPQAAPGYIKTYQALIVPCKLTRDAPFIKVDKVQKDWFFYTPQSEDELTLEAGKKYVYNITVMKDGLDVSFTDTAEWSSKEEKEQTAKIPIKNFGADDLKKFDYYYDDGSWSDGGYRQYEGGKEAWLDIAPEEGKKVIGIVFQTDTSRMSQAEVNAQYRGYAVAVNACKLNYSQSAPSFFRWGKCSDEVASQVGGNVASFADCKGRINGYEASRNVIKQINEEVFDASEYEAFAALAKFSEEYAAPENSSGWYIPSTGQAWDIAENLFGCTFDAEGRANQPAWKNIKTQLEKWVPDAVRFNHKCWTSSPYNTDRAWYIEFDEASSVIRFYIVEKNKMACYVRPILAFR